MKVPVIVKIDNCYDNAKEPYQQYLRKKERCAQIGSHQLVPGFLCGLSNICGVELGGVVNQDIKSSPDLQSVLHHPVRCTADISD